MSSYNVFERAQSYISSTTTGILGSTDAMLVHNVSNATKYWTTPGAVSDQRMVTFRTTLDSTTTFVPPYGVTSFRSTTGSSAVWVLDDPTSVGLHKTLVFNSTSTSTNFSIVPRTATINSTTANGGSLINLAQATTISPMGNAVELVSLSTSVWMVISHSTGVLFS